jgi:hypothetical protein
VAFVFYFQNECRRKSCGEIVKRIYIKVTSIEGKARETKRASKFYKHFAFAI